MVFYTDKNWWQQGLSCKSGKTLHFNGSSRSENRMWPTNMWHPVKSEEKKFEMHVPFKKKPTWYGNCVDDALCLKGRERKSFQLPPTQTKP